MWHPEREWNHKKHLEMLVPKLLGLVGDYAFNELSSEECSNYRVLIKYLKCQFCKVESVKTYATIFWKQDQRGSKTEEAYVTELKCIYRKVYLKCDCFAQDEDVLHRFLNGLTDQQTQQQTEFIKDLGNKVEIVKYREMCQSGNLKRRVLGNTLWGLPLWLLVGLMLLVTQTIVKMKPAVKMPKPPNPSIRTMGVDKMPLMGNPRRVKW